MAAFTEEQFFSTVAEWSARIKAKEVTSHELTKAFSERLEKFGPRYNALALPLSERAVKKAKGLDDDIKRDRFHGPLTGIPFGAKDLLSLSGVPTTWGAKPYAAQVFDHDAAALQKLDKAGAVLIGKLSMVELAGGGGYRFPDASLFGPGINPWDRSRWSGGSSSGSGSAVAAGLVPFAIGSETSGSILTPSAYCGITGLRPTYGLVSRHGAMALAWSMDKLGPMCHSAEDCALVLAAMAGDSNDPGSAGKSFYYAPEFARKMEEIKIGYAPVDFAEWAEPSARPAFEKALADIRSIGVTVVETKLPEFPYKQVTDTVILSEAASIFEPLIRSPKIDQLADKAQIAGLKASLGISATDYLKAMRIRALIKTEFHKLLSDIDILLSPTLYGPATKLSDPLDRRLGDRPVPPTPGMNSLIQAGNLVGLPALSLPCGFADNLPVAIQLVGLPYSENMLIAVGKQYQSKTDWHRRRPKV